jgi:LmbE family N-acetylglucosaminyl deacetylase
VTTITIESGWSEEIIRRRTEEIKRVTKLFGFDSVFELNLPKTQLDQVQMGDLVAKNSNVFKKFEPEEVFVPHPGDVHTDHRLVFDAVTSSTKWFRYPSVK